MLGVHMFRGKLNMAALQFWMSIDIRSIVSVRRLLSLTPSSERESVPATRMLMRPSCAQPGHEARSTCGEQTLGPAVSTGPDPFGVGPGVPSGVAPGSVGSGDGVALVSGVGVVGGSVQKLAWGMTFVRPG